MSDGQRFAGLGAFLVRQRVQGRPALLYLGTAAVRTQDLIFLTVDQGYDPREPPVAIEAEKLVLRHAHLPGQRLA